MVNFVRYRLRHAVLSLLLISAVLVSGCGLFAPVKISEELLAGVISKTWTATKLVDDLGQDVTDDFVSSTTVTFEKSGNFSSQVQRKNQTLQTLTGTWTINKSVTPNILRLTYSGSGAISINHTIRELTETALIVASTTGQGVVTFKSN